MRLPLSWIKEIVDITVSPSELADRLTMAGLEVSAIETKGDGWEYCQVGSVISVDSHPNADRLKLCSVDIGDEQLQVVCGAPNVEAGQRIAFAKSGAELFNTRSGKKEILKSAVIRGIASNGMICSELELGIGDDHSGILVLPDDAPIGMSLHEFLGDIILEVDVPANRPDGLSLLGLAHEIAAICDTRIAPPNLSYDELGPLISDSVSVNVDDPQLCLRYTASLITGVSVGPSPKWMQNRLIEGGMRPINNVVDITNYVMLEYGQPLHAFDFDKIEDQTIIVRQANPNEQFIGLDGIQRTLKPPMLVISDPKKTLGLAGIIGGANSEVSPTSTTIMLEAASFHAFNTRRTGTELKLRTEASLRFEKGERPCLPPMGLRRATQLIVQIAGGIVSSGIIDTNPISESQSSIILTKKRLIQLLGMKLSIRLAQSALQTLGFESSQMGTSSLKVEIPYWRADISIEDDLIEEIARVVGYDKIPTTMISTSIPYHNPDIYRNIKEYLRDSFVSVGFQEIITYPLVGSDVLEKSKSWIENSPEPLKLSNPLRPEHQYLRTELISSTLQTLASNQRFVEGPILLFEIGRRYIPQDGQLPLEEDVLTAVLSGPRSELSWLEANELMNFFDGKGVLETVFRGLNLSETYSVIKKPGLEPGKTAAVYVKDVEIANIGEVNREVLNSFDVVGRPVTYLEVYLSQLLSILPHRENQFTAPPRFPGSERDLALVVNSTIESNKIVALIQKEPLVVETTLFDVYSGSQVPKGKRSLGLRVIFQSNVKTLTSNEIDVATDTILEKLNLEFGAIRRD